jgi:NAD(P)-dependent dehydrogenase (short-subunit alcohol dehydrogenase family)
VRLESKIAIVVGAGQSLGEGMGNGRATALRFVQEGAKVLAVDRLIASAEETAATAANEGGECVPFAADVTDEKTIAAMVAEVLRRWGRIDILRNNVGVSISGGDKPLLELTEEAFDRVCHRPARHGHGLQTRDPGHARAACRRHRQHLVGRGL